MTVTGRPWSPPGLQGATPQPAISERPGRHRGEDAFLVRGGGRGNELRASPSGHGHALFRSMGNPRVISRSTQGDAKVNYGGRRGPRRGNVRSMTVQQVRRTLPVVAVAPPPWAACRSTTCRGGAGAATCARRCTCSPTPSSSRSAGWPAVDGYGDVTDAVYRLVEDTWLDNWSAEKYVGTIFRDSQEAALVDIAVLRVLRIMHQVGPTPRSPRIWSTGWPEAVRAARDAPCAARHQRRRGPGHAAAQPWSVLRHHDAGRPAGLTHCGRAWHPPGMPRPASPSSPPAPPAPLADQYVLPFPARTRRASCTPCRATSS